MPSVVIWINSAPSHPHWSGALALAWRMRAQGRTVSIFLAQDAVLAGVGAEGATAVAEAVQTGIPVYALAEDLQLRGFRPAALADEVRLSNYSDLVDLLARHERLIGAL